MISQWLSSICICLHTKLAVNKAHATLHSQLLPATTCMRSCSCQAGDAMTTLDLHACTCSAAFRPSALLHKLARLERPTTQTKQQACAPLTHLTPLPTAQADPPPLALLRLSQRRGSAQDMWYALQFSCTFAHWHWALNAARVTCSFWMPHVQ